MKIVINENDVLIYPDVAYDWVIKHAWRYDALISFTDAMLRGDAFFFPVKKIISTNSRKNIWR